MDLIERQLLEMRERLRRLENVFERAPVYFVTFCTHQRRPILLDRVLFERLLSFADAGPAKGAWIGAFVIMPDHVHLFVTFGDGAAHVSPHMLGDWMKSPKNALSKALCEIGIPGPHWQKGFFDHVLRSGESYAEQWAYARDLCGGGKNGRIVGSRFRLSTGANGRDRTGGAETRAYHENHARLVQGCSGGL